MNISRKEIVLVMLLFVMAGVYVHYFTGWFRPKLIRIEHLARPMREAWTGAGQRLDPSGTQWNNISFSLHQDYRLTSVEVFRVADQTNAGDHLLWHLVAPAGSEPVNTIAYGVPLPGMTPAIAGMDASPLEPGVEYRLAVRAGSAKGMDDFNIPVRPDAAR